MQSLSGGASPTISRRIFAGSVLAAAIGGSAVAASVGRSEPRLMVVGEDQWQIALLLTSRTRVLLLIGDASRDTITAVPLLLSAMRQRIDVVVGSAPSLEWLPSGFRQRWMVRRTIVWPDEPDTPAPMMNSNVTLHLPQDVRLTVSTSPLHHWATESGSSTRVATSLVTLTRGNSIVAIGSQLEAIAALGPPTTAVAIAPGGSIDELVRHHPAPAICINADEARDQDNFLRVANENGEAIRSLVRIFPEDVAVLFLSPDEVSIPKWRQVFTWR